MARRKRGYYGDGDDEGITNSDTPKKLSSI